MPWCSCDTSLHWFRQDVLGLNYEVPWTYFGDDTIRPKLALHTANRFSIGCGIEVARKRDSEDWLKQKAALPKPFLT